MFYRTVNILVYIISVLLAMYGLQAFDFERFLRKGRISQFYVFYISRVWRSDTYLHNLYLILVR